MGVEILPRTRNQDLPPVASVPILREYGRLGLNRFHQIYGMQTPTDDRGFVDYNKTLDYIMSKVEPGYRWRLEPEVHHLLYEANLYAPEHFDPEELDDDGEPIDPELAGRVRENVFNKIVIPGDLHDLWHVLMIRPQRPDYMNLKQRDRGAHIAMNLFQHAKRAIDLEEREDAFVPFEHPAYTDSLIDIRSRRIIKREVLLERYMEFNQKFNKHLAAVDPATIDALIDVDVLKSDDPIQSIVHDINDRLHMNGTKRGIRAKLTARGVNTAQASLQKTAI